MKISTRSRYGLRALVAIAKSDAKWLASDRIAEQEEVSKKYLDEILRKLRHHGFLEGYRGRRGGYALARSPQEINVLDVIECLEGSTVLVPCVEDTEACTRWEDCPTRPVWQKATESLRNVFRSLTLASFLECGEECDGPTIPSFDLTCAEAEAPAPTAAPEAEPAGD